MSSEVWKNIPGYELVYQVSSLGRIKRISYYRNTYPGRVLTPNLDSRGYLRVHLSQNNKSINRSIHQLVLEAFVGPRPKGLQCRHLNGNRLDNRLANLKWGTPAENQKDSIRHKTKFQPNTRGSNSGMAKLNESQVIQIRKLYATKKLTQKQIGDKFGVGATAISQIVNRKRWEHVK